MDEELTDPLLKAQDEHYSIYDTEVVVLQVFEGVDDNYPPENIGQFLLWLNAAIQQIPVECRPSATLTTWLDRDGLGTVTVSYRRPATDDEIAKRKRDARAYRVRQKRALRLTLRKLKVEKA